MKNIAFPSFRLLFDKILVLYTAQPRTDHWSNLKCYVGLPLLEQRGSATLLIICDFIDDRNHPYEMMQCQENLHADAHPLFPCFIFFLVESLLSTMETSTPMATEKKECKASGLDGNGFSDLTKKPPPTTVARGMPFRILRICGTEAPWLLRDLLGIDAQLH